jgi:multisubunit Na+/H+ antiporter MnhB subunit
MLFAAVVGPALIGVLLLQNVNPLVNPPRVPLLTVIDTLAVGTAIILFGLALIRKLKPSRGRRMARLWPYIAFIIAALFILWGGLQPAYIVFQGKELSHSYFGLLLVLKLLCGLSVIIVASISMKERLRFET